MSRMAKTRNLAGVHTHTHTSDLENKIEYIKKKDNIILPNIFYDTG